MSKWVGDTRRDSGKVKEEVLEMRFALRNDLVRFSLVAFALAGILSAQHSHGGGSAPAAHSSGGFHSNGPAPIGLRQLGPTYTGITPGALNTRNVFNRGPVAQHRWPAGNRNRNVGAYWVPSYLPWLDNDGYGSTPYESMGYQADAAEQTAEVTAGMLGEQVQRLSGEIEEMRSAPAAYQQQQQSYARAPQNEPPPPPAVRLVLRGGQQLQVMSYAVMGETFWDFSQQPARRIPVASIDIAASAKATEAAGGEFPVL